MTNVTKYGWGAGEQTARKTTAAERTLRSGDIFLEKYRIDRQIGCGGMGIVYAATDLDLHRKVAIKVLLPEIAAMPMAAARFVHEGRAAARIEGEHVARVFAAGRTPEGLPYMVLELLDGIDLEGFLQQRGRLEIGEAAGILLQALQGVEEAHRHGIVHRDLKPANLFLHRRGDGSLVVKVIDFGVSKASRPAAGDDDQQSLTVTKTLLGSPAYMSPEQLYDAKRVDARTDIWSLGVILHEMLAGVAPFEESSLSELVVAILHKPPPPLKDLRPDVPPGLEAVLAGCLERDREKRIPSASALAAALVPFAGPGEIDMTPRLAPSAPSDRSQPPQSSGERLRATSELSPFAPTAHDDTMMLLRPPVPRSGFREMSLLVAIAAAIAALLLAIR